MIYGGKRVGDLLEKEHGIALPCGCSICYDENASVYVSHSSYSSKFHPSVPGMHYNTLNVS
jgi:hypothetical protein